MRHPIHVLNDVVVMLEQRKQYGGQQLLNDVYDLRKKLVLLLGDLVMIEDEAARGDSDNIYLAGNVGSDLLEATMWDTYAYKLDLPDQAWGKTFLYDGGEFVIIGVAPDRPTRPVKARCITAGTNTHVGEIGYFPHEIAEVAMRYFQNNKENT